MTSAVNEPRVALIYSDGSISIYPPGTPIEQARAEALTNDPHETRPEHFTSCGFVTIAAIRNIETPRLAAAGTDVDGMTTEQLRAEVKRLRAQCEQPLAFRDSTQTSGEQRKGVPSDRQAKSR